MWHRFSLVVLVGVAGCGGSDVQKHEVTIKLERPEPVKIDKVEFDLQGVKIGDDLSAFAPDHKPKKPLVMALDSIIMEGHEVSLTLYFYERKLISINMTFDDAAHDAVIAAYTAKLGRPPQDVEKDYRGIVKSRWYTTSGPLTIYSSGSGALATPEFARLDYDGGSDFLEHDRFDGI